MSRRRINQVTCLLLIIGLGAAAIAYFASAPALDDPAMDQIKDSKIYQQQMKLVGGESSLLMADLQHWFSGLWHGRSLAATLAVLTLAVIFAFRFVASHPDYIKEEAPPQPHRPPEKLL